MAGDAGVSFRAFARILGEGDATHIRQLAKAGRLVLTEDGRRVQVAPSLERIRACSAPALPVEATATFAGFARILGERSPGYVTLLKQTGRLVLTEDGKRIRVAESLALVRATADPAKAPVADRHAATRAAKAGEGSAPAPIAAPAPAGEAAPLPDEGGEREGYQYWRERKEKAAALASERENAIADGLLMVAADVEAAIAAAATTLRSRLESLPQILGPQLAAITDEAQASATIAEVIEHALEEASRQFAAIGRSVADA